MQQWGRTQALRKLDNYLSVLEIVMETTTPCFQNAPLIRWWRQTGKAPGTVPGL